MASPGGKTRRFVRPARSELAAYGRYLLGPRSTGVRALIFGQGRSGSTLLENLLCSSNHFTRNGEVLNPRKRRMLYPRAYLEGLSRKRPHDHYVCHVKPYHLDRDRLDVGARAVDQREFLKCLSDDGWRIIHLVRDNKVRQFISNEVAKARGAFKKVDDRPENHRISVDREQFDSFVAFRIDCARREDEALKDIPHIEVHYEADLESPEMHQVTADRLMDYLGLERRPVASTVRKINTRALADIVANYEELSAWARELGVGHWLD